MSLEFPDWINPWAAAQGRRIFKGTIPLTRMPRLVNLLEDSAGEVGFNMALDLDTDKRPVIQIEVEAGLPLMCQASLKPYVHQVKRSSLLAVIESEAEIELLPGHYEPVLLEQGKMALAELVEDELLLGLPQVPRNPDLGAVEYQTGDTEQIQSAEETPRKAFSELQSLLQKSAGKAKQD